jgi:murein DD-endopeptidase MepM/ murein hydrolase activator NlpD
MSRADVAEANNLTVKSKLRPGQELIIPRAPATTLAARSERAAPTAVASRSIAEPAATPAATAPAKVETITYRVKKGDTLFSIAQLFDTTVAKIKRGIASAERSPRARLRSSRPGASPSASVLFRDPIGVPCSQGIRAADLAVFAPLVRMLARVRSAAVFGIEATPVSIEVDVSYGLPCFTVVGLPDAIVRESRDRIRSAIRNSGYEFPPHRITVNLAPADVRKAGSSFDLPIALGSWRRGVIQHATTGRADSASCRLDPGGARRRRRRHARRQRFRPAAAGLEHAGGGGRGGLAVLPRALAHRGGRGTERSTSRAADAGTAGHAA